MTEQNPEHFEAETVQEPETRSELHARASAALSGAQAALARGSMGEAWLSYLDHASYLAAAATHERSANAGAAGRQAKQPFPNGPKIAVPFTQWLDGQQRRLAGRGESTIRDALKTGQLPGL